MLLFRIPFLYTVLCMYSAWLVAADGALIQPVSVKSDALTYELIGKYEPQDKYQQDQGHRSYYCVRTKGENSYFAACHIEDAANVCTKIKLMVREFPGVILMGYLRAHLKEQIDAQKFQAISETFFDAFNPADMHAAFNQSDQQLINYVVNRTQRYGGQRKNQLMQELNGTHRSTSAAAFAELWSTSMLVRAEFWLTIARYTHASAQRMKESTVFEFIPKEKISDAEQGQSGVIYPMRGYRISSDHGDRAWRAHGMRDLNKALISSVHDITLLAYDLAVYALQHPSMLDLYTNRSHTLMCIDLQKAQAAAEKSLMPKSYPKVYNKREPWMEAALEKKKEKID